MNVEKYKNCYGDEFTFTLLDDGNIQWDGNFKYCRFSMNEDEHLTMVDPSGGPYLEQGMKLMGQIIREFKNNGEGFLIITE